MRDTMEQIRRDLDNITRSPLADDRRLNGTLAVVGEGDKCAKIMLIGEAPGKKESETGIPFCGASGKVLDRLLGDVGLDRSTVYITNVVKDRPPRNRDPKPDEIATYAPLLDRQIAIIKPAVIATLGRFAMEYVMDRYGLVDSIGTISDTRGKVYKTDIAGIQVDVIPLFHPAVAVYNRNRYNELLADIEILRQTAVNNV